MLSMWNLPPGNGTVLRSGFVPDYRCGRPYPLGGVYVKGASPPGVPETLYGGRERRIMRMYDIIMKKRDGGVLTDEEIGYFVNGYTEGEIPDYQASALLMAIYFRG